MLTDWLRAHRRAAPATGDVRWGTYPAPVRKTLVVVQGLAPEGRDALLYGCSAVFAAITAFAVGIPLYRQWGQMAVGPYGAATLLMTVAAWRMARTTPGQRDPKAAGGLKVVRVVAFLIVLFGATVVPLTMEVIWRSEGNAALHVQPEVTVVEQAGDRAAHGKDPYQVVDRNGHIVIHEHTEPIYELYYPYLPGMVVFGYSTGATVSGNEIEARLTDARIQFLLFTTLVTLLALSRIRPPTDARVRALQVLTVLPTAALPLATGGDDMPVAGLMLLGLVALQRRRPLVAGLIFGAASSLKFTAWPLAIIGLWAAYDLARKRALGRYLLGLVLVTVPVVLPVALRNPTAFVDNVIKFPLGLAGVSSPAASALPGHIIVSALPGIHRAYLVVVGLIGGTVLVRYLIKRPPRTAAQVARLAGWVMLVAILLAPATRVGYLLYPINLFVWAWMLRQADEPPPRAGTPSSGDEEPADAGSFGPADQLSSGCSYSSSENGVSPADVVGETTAPTSQ